MSGPDVPARIALAPGGTSDILGRRLAQELTTRIGRSVVVDNRAGAGGSIGTAAAVQGDPDGSVILLHSGAISVEPALKPSLAYDVRRDLTPVTTAVAGPFAVLVSTSLPVRTMAEPSI